MFIFGGKGVGVSMEVIESAKVGRGGGGGNDGLVGFLGWVLEVCFFAIYVPTSFLRITYLIHYITTAAAPSKFLECRL